MCLIGNNVRLKGIHEIWKSSELMQALTTTIQMIYKYFPNGNIKKKRRNERKQWQPQRTRPSVLISCQDIKTGFILVLLQLLLKGEFKTALQKLATYNVTAQRMGSRTSLPSASPALLFTSYWPWTDHWASLASISPSNGDNNRVISGGGC